MVYKVLKKVFAFYITVFLILGLICPNYGLGSSIIYSKNVNDSGIDSLGDFNINKKGISSSDNKNWTVICYLDGDFYDMENAMLKHFNDLELVGSSPRVNVVAQIDDYGCWGNQTRRYYIEHDEDLDVINSPIVDGDTCEKDMGNPQTLLDFFNWSVVNYPAENYCLLMSNHGSSFRGVGWDQTNNLDEIDMVELKYSMNEINKLLGKKLDMVIFHACVMGTVEVLYQIKDYVEICIAAQVPCTSSTLSYTGALQNITENPSLNATDFAEKIINSSGSRANGNIYHRLFGQRLNKI